MNNFNLNKGIPFCFLLLFLATSKNADAYSAGPPNGYTGQPPERSTCALSRACHIADLSDAAGIEISLKDNPEIFVSGQTYEVTVKVSDPIADCFGFQIGVQFEADRSNAGDFTLPAGAEGYIKTNTGSYQYIEHNTPSSSGTWNFEWTAPSDNRGSNIIFYAAGIAAMCDGDPNTDATYLTTKMLSSSCGGISINENVNGYVIDAFCDFTEIEPRVALNLESITGGSGSYTIETFGNSSVSNANVSENEPFTYFFSEDDALQNTVGFEVKDGSGSVCRLDEETISGLIGFIALCNRPCTAPIEVSFQQGVVDEFNCNGSTEISIDVSNIEGGTGQYYLSTLGFGTLSNEVVSSRGFTYSFNLEEASGETIGFIINDQNGCVQQFDYTQNFPYDELLSLCSATCTSNIEITVAGGLDEPIIGCDNTNPTDVLYSINVESIIGGNGNYEVLTLGGLVSPQSFRIEDGFYYIFTQQIVDDEAAIFNITDNEFCNQEFNFTDYFSSLALEELCECSIEGCLDETACNYNPMACIDDGSCLATGCDPGCTDICAPNYNPQADEDDGSCETYDTTCNSDCLLADIESWDADICTCVPVAESIIGCTNVYASNYNPNATCDDGSCNFTGCTDKCAPNYNPDVVEDDGSCDTYDTTCNNDCTLGNLEIWDANACRCALASQSIVGCTNVTALNYNPLANCNDDSCFFNELTGCTDPCSANYNPDVTLDDGTCEAYNSTCNTNCAYGDIEAWDPVNCECVVVDICTETCDASAGELRPIQFDTFCTLSAMVTLPVQFGYNINLEYIFLITNENLDIVAQSSGFRTDLTGLAPGKYCIYGMSYDSDNAPDLTVSNVENIIMQSSACFSITRDCILLTIQSEAEVNPFAPLSSTDTIFLCTGYTVPIDFCIDIQDEDGGQPFLVDIISFCNPSIEGDSCVHYPPLPGLLPGDTEIISLIYCDDDCPQLCDTSYAAISILDDCNNFMQPDTTDMTINCLVDTILTCATPEIPIELCLDCSYATTEYFINNISSIGNPTLEVQSGNCINYIADESLAYDSLIVELCSWEITHCIKSLFVIDIGDCTTEEKCPQLFACTPPKVEQRICLECEASNNPNAVITNIKTKFDECVINLVDQMCFDYIPLPLMNIIETDTAIITYCDELTGDCFETDVIITYSNCDEGGLQLVATNDYFEAFENEIVELPVLENDVNTSSTIINIINQPANGQIFITDNQVIEYTPEENFTGTDQLTYEICIFDQCNQAEVFIEVYPEQRTLQYQQLIHAYPNPASNQLTVEFDLQFDNTYVFISMYNALGEAIYNSKELTNAGFQKYIIDVTQFNKGIYIINVSLGLKKQSLKILVD